MPLRRLSGLHNRKVAFTHALNCWTEENPKPPNAPRSPSAHTACTAGASNPYRVSHLLLYLCGQAKKTRGRGALGARKDWSLSRLGHVQHAATTVQQPRWCDGFRCWSVRFSVPASRQEKPGEIRLQLRDDWVRPPGVSTERNGSLHDWVDPAPAAGGRRLTRLRWPGERGPTLLSW